MKKYPVISTIAVMVIILTTPSPATPPQSFSSFIHPDSAGLSALYSARNSSREESLYVAIIQHRNPNQYLNFILTYPGSPFSGLLACRYLLLELSNGAQPEILVRNLNEIGCACEMIKLYPTIRHDVSQLTRAAVFPGYNIQMWLRENYSRQLLEDPYVEWYLDYDRILHIPFDALHLLARNDYFRAQDPYTQFLASDSLGLNHIQKNFTAILQLMQDFSHQLGYPSLEAIFSQVMDRRFTLNGQLSVLVYDPDEFRQRYRLKDSGWSYPYHGLVFINPTGKSSRRFMEVFIHKLSHIFLSGNRFNIHHGASRWFDEGFAQWASYCYLSFQQLIPRADSYQQEKMAQDILKIRRDASALLPPYPKRLKLSQVNRQCKEHPGLKGEPVNNLLALSLMAYLVEKYGMEKLLETAGRVSREGQNFTEASLKTVLGVNYSYVEKGWNEWLRQVPPPENSVLNEQ